MTIERTRFYHGTTSDVVQKIIMEGLRPSRGAGHWLGNGCVYLSDDPDFALLHAAERARRLQENTHLSIDPVLLTAEVDMTDCFDLRLLRFRKEAGIIGQKFVDSVPPEVWPEINQNKDSRRFDSMVLRHIMNTARTPGGKPYSSLMAILSQRGASVDPTMTPEARPLFRAEGAFDADEMPLESWLNLHDHLELAVFNLSRIHNLGIA